MSRFRRSVAGKLMLLFFLVGVMSLCIVGIYSYYKAKNAILKRTLDQLTSIRVMKKSQVELFFNDRFRVLNLVGNAVSRDARGGYRMSVEGDSATHPYGSIYFVGSDELVKTSSGVITPADDPALVHHLRVLLGEIRKSGAGRVADLFKRKDSVSGPTGLIATPVRDDSGEIRGIVAMDLDGDALNEIMLEKSSENGLGKSGEAYIVGRDRLMRTGSRFIPNSVLRIKVNTLSVAKAFSSGTGQAIIDDYRTVPCLSSYSRLEIPGLDWVLIAEIDYEEAMIPIVGIRNDLVLISLVISILIFSMAPIISRTITQPLVNLKTATSSIGEGKFDIRVEVTGQDEIGILGRTFNEMAVQLEEERTRRMNALYDGQELERQRVARELHDGLGQMMVALKMKFENCLESPSEGRDAKLSELRKDFTAIIGEVRKVSYDLAPSGISEFGLDSAMKLLCTEVGSHSSTHTEFTCFGSFDSLGEKTRNYLFRIAQEALNNSVKHSGASNIYIHLAESAENVVLMVEDDGKGIATEGKPGNGLQNMRERARLLGGKFDLESAPGKGTTIRVKIPKSTKNHN